MTCDSMFLWGMWHIGGLGTSLFCSPLSVTGFPVTGCQPSDLHNDKECQGTDVKEGSHEIVTASPKDQGF